MSPGSSAVRVRLFAGAADAVGRREVELEGVTTVGSILDRLGADREPRIREVLDQCSILIDGERARSPGTPVAAGTTVDILPPFAGGAPSR